MNDDFDKAIKILKETKLEEDIQPEQIEYYDIRDGTFYPDNQEVPKYMKSWFEKDNDDLPF